MPGAVPAGLPAKPPSPIKKAVKKRGPKKVCEICELKKPTHGLRSDVNNKRWCAGCAKTQKASHPAGASQSSFAKRRACATNVQDLCAHQGRLSA